MKINADVFTTSAFLPSSSSSSAVVCIVAELLTPWYRNLLELLTSLRLVEAVHWFYQAKMFITFTTKVCHFILSSEALLHVNFNFVFPCIIV